MDENIIHIDQGRKKKAKKTRKPMGGIKRLFLNLLVTAIIGFIYFYVTLPAINLQAQEFYAFAFLLCVVYIITALITSGSDLLGAGRGGVKEYAHFVRKQALPVGILLVLLVVLYLVGSLIGAPLFRAADYRDLLTVEDGDFASDITEISFREIPMLDESSAKRLGDRKMGELADMVSQFEVSDDYVQINYQGRPVRVSSLEYGDVVKWFTNRTQGLPGYILVDMVTQEAEVVRLEQGMKYSTSELFGRNIYRYLRFCYPTYMFNEVTFEISEDGTPYWVCPRVVKRIGLFSGTDIDGAVLVNAVTGEHQYYSAENVPNWVDRVYLASLIVNQYNYHGIYVNGFINSMFGQRDVTVTTELYNYIALNDDVYMYTGITSVSADQSNIGFLLSNQRTKETRFYPAAGATESSAKNSAQGRVQQFGYKATDPLLLNIGGEPTYFMSLKDNAELVKMYAMVNVSQYQVVATGETVVECERNYLALLQDNGISTQPLEETSSVKGYIEELRSAVVDGTTRYYIRLRGEQVFYRLSAASDEAAILLSVGDRVTLTVTDEDGSSILTARLAS